MQFDYANVKDKIRNDNFLKMQHNAYNEFLNKTIDETVKAGGTRLDGIRKAKNSAEYKFITMRMGNLAKAFDANFDEANKVIATYEGGNKDAYYSDDEYKAAKSFVGNFLKEDVTLEDLQSDKFDPSKFTKAISTYKSLKDYTTILSDNVTSALQQAKANGMNINTDETNVYEIIKNIGMSPDKVEIWAEQQWNDVYGNLPAKDRPSLEKYKREAQNMVKHQLELSLHNVGKTSALDYAKFAREKEQDLVQTPQDNVKLNVNYGGNEYTVDVNDEIKIKPTTIALQSYRAYDPKTGTFITKPIGGKGKMLYGVGTVNVAGKKVPVGYTTNANGETEIVDYTDISQQFKIALRDQKTKVDLTKSQQSTYGDLGGTVKEEQTTPASGTTTTTTTNKEDKWKSKELK
jgi:hypothetical protein